MTRPRPKSPSPYVAPFGRAVFSCLALLAALQLSWVALAQTGFLYGFWHDALDIDTTISVYGPRNRTRPGFHTTDKAERTRLFNALVDGIHSDDPRFDRLVYHDRAGRPLGRLLTSPEITHLRSVAAMVRRLEVVGWVSLAALAVLLAGLRLARTPTVTGSLRTLLAIIALAGIFVLAAGPVRVFYAWHEWAFPAGQAWFFYYEDSLMTMLMKAPDIFACIGASWMLLATLVFTAIMAIARRMTGGAATR